MDQMKESIRKPWVIPLIAFIAGLLIGWMLFGWFLFPVEWTDATPSYLRQDLKQDYLKMAIDSYTANQDALLAKGRYTQLGESADEIFAAILANPGSVKTSAITAFADVIGIETGTLPTPGASGGTENTGGFKLPSLSLIIGIFCGLSVILGVVLLLLLARRKRTAPSIRSSSIEQPAQAESEEVGEIKAAAMTGGDSPIAQFMTTYMTGDEQYDDSFSIDTPMGDFLGECGIGISDTIGVGEPKKVSAFEVWLFDKNDIQTVTKVVMSDHIYNDPNAHQRLLAKGEPVLAAAGKRILLGTQSLQLEARIVDMNYGQGALPADSYFERMTIEMRIWAKPKVDA
jgi:hypothetical protein